MNSSLRSISHNQQSLKCGKHYGKLVGQFVSSSLLALSQMRLLIQTRLKDVIHGCHAGNILKVASKEAVSNDRMLVGYVLMIIGAAFYWAHFLFIQPEFPSIFAFIPDAPLSKEVFYYKQKFYWFFTNREEFFGAFFLTGLFVMIPKNQGYKFLFLPVIAGCVCEVVFQSFQIDSYTDFYMPFYSKEVGLTERAWEVVVVSCVSVFGLIKFAQYLVWAANHRRRAHRSRMDGLIQFLDMSNPINKGIETTWKEIKEQNY
jgi:hypothetical protein